MAQKQKITLTTLSSQISSQITSLATQMQKGFGAVASDIADIKHEIVDMKQDIRDTINHLFQVQTQVNSIETQIRDMHHVKLQDRVLTLEEKVFGHARA